MSSHNGQRARRHDERGAIALLSALLLTVFMGFGAMGFDLAYVRLARLEMKNATDAATHAAMYVLRTTRKTADAMAAAEIIAGKNTVLGHAVTLVDADIKFGQWDWDAATFTETTPANAVQIYAHTADPSWADGTVKTTLGNLIGVSSANIAQTGSGSYRPRTTMFEADITGSLMITACGIDQAIAAEIAFGQAMFDAGVVKDRLGLDVFVGDATAVSPIAKLSTNWSTMKSLWTGDGNTAQHSNHTRGLGMCHKIGLAGTVTGSWGAPNCGANWGFWPNLDKIDGAGGVIQNPSCWDGDFHYAPTTTVYAGTNIGGGIKAGWDKIKAFAKSYDVRSIVLFTDGGPMCCEAKGGGNYCPQPPGNNCCADGTLPFAACSDTVGGKACQCGKDVYDYGIQMAQDAHNQDDIDIYVLIFSGTQRWIDYAGLLAQGRGFTLSTNDPALLGAKMTQIANAIPISLVK